MDAALWAVALSIVGLAFVLLFKTPKEVSKEIEVRVGTLEERHMLLDRGVLEFKTQFIIEFRHLTEAVNHLASVMERAGLTTGEHRIVKRRGE